MQDSFLNHARFRYLWWAMILMIGSLVAYIWHEPLVTPNGGTWLGYTLGTIGAVLILWLTLFGYRKRTYNNNVGTLRGWLSGHVYLGGSLILARAPGRLGEYLGVTSARAAELLSRITGSMTGKQRSWPP